MEHPSRIIPQWFIFTSRLSHWSLVIYKRNLKCCGAIDNVYPGFQSQSGSLTWVLSCLGCNWFISGATPADVLAASMAAEPFWSKYLHMYCWGSSPGIERAAVFCGNSSVCVCPAKARTGHRFPSRRQMDQLLPFYLYLESASNMYLLLYPLVNVFAFSTQFLDFAVRPIPVS